MSLRERTTPRSVFIYVLGLFFVSIGSASSVVGGFGVSSGIICMTKLHTLGSVGIGTVIIAFTLGSMVGIYKKNFRKRLEKFLKLPAAI